MTLFAQLNHNTGVTHIVSINNMGRWHSYSTPRQDFKIYNSLAAFQIYFNCTNEDMMLIKLKYGEPVPYYRIRRPTSMGPQ